MKVVFSHYEVRPVLEAFRRGERKALFSPDLGRTRVSVTLSAQGIHLPDGTVLPWSAAQMALERPTVCFLWEGEEVQALQRYSESTGRMVQLYPTGHAPTVLLSGIAMHRIRGLSPWADTENKIRAARPRGRVLDTCGGLGYTAIQAAARADWVLSVEMDPTVVALARQNPWSEAWFTHPCIHLVLGDVLDLVVGFPDAFFDTVLHDPPQFGLAGDLYGQDFYRELWRVLKPGGRLFHYIGSPDTRMGRNVTRGVVRRLQEVGFRDVRRVPHAFGVVAVKSG